MRVTVSLDTALTRPQRAAVRAASIGSLLRTSGTALGVGDRASLSARLTHDGELRELNRSYRGIDEPTDVLSFPGDDDGVPGVRAQRVGDIVVSVERALAQSEDGVAELRLLAVHGLLHCLGFDHATARGAAAMTAATRNLLGDQRVAPLVAH